MARISLKKPYGVFVRRYPMVCTETYLWCMPHVGGISTHIHNDKLFDLDKLVTAVKLMWPSRSLHALCNTLLSPDRLHCRRQLLATWMRSNACNLLADLVYGVHCCVRHPQGTNGRDKDLWTLPARTFAYVPYLFV